MKSLLDEAFDDLAFTQKTYSKYGIRFQLSNSYDPALNWSAFLYPTQNHPKAYVARTWIGKGATVEQAIDSALFCMATELEELETKEPNSHVL